MMKLITLIFIFSFAIRLTIPLANTSKSAFRKNKLFMYVYMCMWAHLLTSGWCDNRDG